MNKARVFALAPALLFACVPAGRDASSLGTAAAPGGAPHTAQEVPSSPSAPREEAAVPPTPSMTPRTASSTWTGAFALMGFTPTEPPPPRCGDGAIDPGEACDDGNGADRDGCNAACAIEEGWDCTDEPSLCRFVPPVSLPPNHASPLGQNLTHPNYFAASWPFVDVMKLGDPFFSGSDVDWRDARPLDLDTFGWPRSLLPGQVARSFLLGYQAAGVTFPVPAGEYTVLYEGEGTLRYLGANTVVSSAPGQDILQLGPQGEIIVEIAATNPSNPLRNVRVIAPGGRCGQDVRRYCEAASDCAPQDSCVPFTTNYEAQPFHPDFLAEQAPFKTLRFMQWMEANREAWLVDGVDEPMPISDWAEYPTRQHASWHPVPVDVMMQLTNTLSADPWITIPHTATDDFVRRLAVAVRDGMDSGSTVYVEYSNEVWNQIFDQYYWAGAQGCQRWEADPETTCARPGESLCQPGDWDAPAEACLRNSERFFAVRTAEVMAIFDQVFAQSPKRVVRVFGAQVGGWGWRTEAQLLVEHAPGRLVADAVDAVAVAPYFGHDIHPTTVDEAFVVNDVPVHGTPAGTYRMLSGNPDEPWGGPIQWVGNDLAGLRGRPETSHLDYVAYEGGQHLTSWDPQEMALYHAINADPRMKDVFVQLLEQWQILTGGAPFVHFESASSGIWGVKAYQGQPRHEAPKYDALVSVVERVQAQLTAP